MYRDSSSVSQQKRGDEGGPRNGREDLIGQHRRDLLQANADRWYHDGAYSSHRSSESRAGGSHFSGIREPRQWIQHHEDAIVEELGDGESSHDFGWSHCNDSLSSESCIAQCCKGSEECDLEKCTERHPEAHEWHVE